MFSNEQLDRFSRAVSKLGEAALECVRALSSMCGTIIQNIGPSIKWAQFLDDYPNQRVVHLAYHAKKKRTRKKNLSRLKKDFEARSIKTK